MMEEYLELGSSPADEECAQVGDPDYADRAQRECAAWARQLTREFPRGRFSVKWFRHDFGSYAEVVARWSTPEEEEAAFAAESGARTTWDAIAKAELGIPATGLPAFLQRQAM